MWGNWTSACMDVQGRRCVSTSTLSMSKFYRITSQSSPSPKPTPQGGEVKAETSNSEKPWLRSELPQQEDGAATGGKRSWWHWLMGWWCYWWWWSWWSDFIGMMIIVQDLEVNNRQLLSNTERMRTELDRVVQVTMTEKFWSASFLLPSIIVLLGETPL